MVMTNSELLLEMSNMLDSKFESMKKDIIDIKADVAELKSDVAELKSDVAELKSDVTQLKSDVAELKSDVIQLKLNVTKLESNVTKLESKVIQLESNTTRINIMLENDMMPRLQNIESGYVSTYERYKNGISQIDSMQADINILKIVVTEHSEKLQQLA